MIKRIVHFALNQPLYIILGLVLFIGIGITSFRSLPIEAFPDVTDTQVTIISLYPGRAPQEVEKDRKSTRLNSSHSRASRMPSSA